MKEIVIKIKFDDSDGYDGHGEDVGEIIESIIKPDYKIETERSTGNIVKSLNERLDQWIEGCEKQAEIFGLNGMETAQISSDAMAQAYWNVKQFIDVNNVMEE